MNTFHNLLSPTGHPNIGLINDLNSCIRLGSLASSFSLVKSVKDYIFMTNGLARGFNSLVGFAINGFIVKGYSDGILTIGCHRLNVKQLREVLGL